MFRVIGGVVVYGFAMYGAAVAVSKYERVVKLVKSRGEVSEDRVEEKGVKETSAAE